MSEWCKGGCEQHDAPFTFLAAGERNLCLALHAVRAASNDDMRLRPWDRHGARRDPDARERKGMKIGAIARRLKLIERIPL